MKFMRTPRRIHVELLVNVQCPRGRKVEANESVPMMIGRINQIEANHTVPTEVIKLEIDRL
jgi:hypothetical protein